MEFILKRTEALRMTEITKLLVQACFHFHTEIYSIT